MVRFEASANLHSLDVLEQAIVETLAALSEFSPFAERQRSRPTLRHVDYPAQLPRSWPNRLPVRVAGDSVRLRLSDVI
jgi:hypothetical protein